MGDMLETHIDELGDDEASRKIRQDALATADTITKLVKLLALTEGLGGEPVQTLMKGVYCLIGSRTTPATVSQMVQTPSAVCMGNRTDPTSLQMLLVFPVGWSRLA